MNKFLVDPGYTLLCCIGFIIASIAIVFICGCIHGIIANCKAIDEEAAKYNDNEKVKCRLLDFLKLFNNFDKYIELERYGALADVGEGRYYYIYFNKIDTLFYMKLIKIAKRKKMQAALATALARRKSIEKYVGKDTANHE